MPPSTQWRLMVIGVRTRSDASLWYAKASRDPYGIGFTRINTSGAHSFPHPGAAEMGVNLKLNPIRALVDGSAHRADR